MTITRKTIESNIHGYNAPLPTEYLEKLTYVELLRLAHPLDRLDFARQLHKQGMLSDDDLRMFTHAKSRQIKTDPYGYAKH